MTEMRVSIDQIIVCFTVDWPIVCIYSVMLSAYSDGRLGSQPPTIHDGFASNVSRPTLGWPWTDLEPKHATTIARRG